MRPLAGEDVGRLARALRAPDLSGTRFLLLREIGRGGMGSVWEAEDPDLARSVAVEVLDLPDDSGDLAARLRLEARVLARLEHPGIVPVHDVGSLPDGCTFHSMKIVRRERLDESAARLATLPEKLRLFLRVCEPVAFAHSRGVVHRDLKPENVMVGPFGEVLVLDCRIARVVEDEARERAAPRERTRRSRRPTSGSPARGPPPARGDRLAGDGRPAGGEVPRRSVSGRGRDPPPGWRSGHGRSRAGMGKAARFAVRHRVALLLVAAYLAARAAILLVYRR